MRKGKKKNVVIYLGKGVAKEAKELGLNISISRKCLKRGNKVPFSVVR